MVPCSNFDFEVKLESKVTQMSVWPVDSTNDVQCDAVRKTVGEINEPLQTIRNWLSLGRKRG
jgi:hypothetical protein